MHRNDIHTHAHTTHDIHLPLAAPTRVRVAHVPASHARAGERMSCTLLSSNY